jgi:hypothetical protein
MKGYTSAPLLVGSGVKEAIEGIKKNSFNAI